MERLAAGREATTLMARRSAGRLLVGLSVLLAMVTLTPMAAWAAGGWSTGWPAGQPANGVVALVAHPSDPSVAYAATSGGMYRTGNAGAAWSRVGNLTDIAALAVATASPNTLYALTTSAGGASQLWRSDDAGQTWNTPNPSPNPALTGPSVLLVDRASATTLFAGTGATGAGNGRILKSTDGGVSWRQVYAVSSLLTVGTISSIVQAPSDPRILYAGHTVYHGGTILISQDDGESWTALPLPPEPLFFPIALAVAPNDSRIVYVAMQAPTGSGARVYRSSNRGQSWTKVGQGLPTGLASATTLAIDPSDGSRMFLALQGPTPGVYASMDAGVTWALLGSSSPPLDSVAALAVAASGHEVYAGTSNGVWQYAPPTPTPGAIDPRFAAYYNSHDGLRLLGHPISGPTSIGDYYAQYFEKGRIEDHSLDTPDPTWHFMDGLLVDALHERQVNLPVGGNVSTVTYATIHQAAAPANRLPPPAGFSGGVAVRSDGSVFVPFTTDLSPAPGHTIPARFWSYLNNRRYSPGGWLHDSGLPITEPMVAVVDKGPIKGRRIVIQAFQRTVLTDDPLNPAGWQIERANVGSDYLQSFPIR